MGRHSKRIKEIRRESSNYVTGVVSFGVGLLSFFVVNNLYVKIAVVAFIVLGYFTVSYYYRSRLLEEELEDLEEQLEDRLEELKEVTENRDALKGQHERRGKQLQKALSNFSFVVNELLKAYANHEGNECQKSIAKIHDEARELFRESKPPEMMDDE